MKINKITIFGAGYVGMSLAALLSQSNKVNVCDINSTRVKLINNLKSTIDDKKIDSFLKEYSDNIFATTDLNIAIKNTDLILIATSTNYNEDSNYFDTSSVEHIIKNVVDASYSGPIVIKSTVPIGFTKKINSLYKNNVIFSPEFLREGSALEDNLKPSRIIMGSKCDDALEIAKLFNQATTSKKTPVLYMSSKEAEAVKLFSNTYLAMRVAYFNELDSYALKHDLDTKNIIDGVSLDKRIGNFYNNPSFGFGGYCLPKDSKQLLANFVNTPQSIISSVIKSNDLRKNFIANEIIKLKPKTVGIFKLSMKEGSDNYRFSAVLDIIDFLTKKNINVIIYEPLIKDFENKSVKIIQDLNDFKNKSDLIICNRLSKLLKDVETKIFSRDIFNTN